jgi:hypothetical protein
VQKALLFAKLKIIRGLLDTSGRYSFQPWQISSYDDVLSLFFGRICGDFLVRITRVHIELSSVDYMFL